MLVFFDDILVNSRGLNQHVEHLKVVLELLRSNALVVKQCKNGVVDALSRVPCLELLA